MNTEDILIEKADQLLQRMKTEPNLKIPPTQPMLVTEHLGRSTQEDFAVQVQKAHAQTTRRSQMPLTLREDTSPVVDRMDAAWEQGREQARAMRRSIRGETNPYTDPTEVTRMKVENSPSRVQRGLEKNPDVPSWVRRALELIESALD